MMLFCKKTLISGLILSMGLCLNVQGQTQNAATTIDLNLTLLAREMLGAQHYQQFLDKHAQSKEDLPNAFVFDKPPAGTQGKLTQIFWNEPNSLFVMINLGRQHNLLPGHILHYYKRQQDPTSMAGALAIIKTDQHSSYAQILFADQPPAVNDWIQ